jgi:hypothetical protein
MFRTFGRRVGVMMIQDQRGPPPLVGLRDDGRGLRPQVHVEDRHRELVMDPRYDRRMHALDADPVN